jgi:tetratricopeptide (TPR) repeat protein
LPEAPAPQSSDPETERFLLFKAVAELLRVVARSVPLCVVLDDFQWADGQSVALLKHVARSVEQGQLQMLVTYRDSDLTKDHPLSGVLADLHRLQGVERIALRGLAVDDVAALMAAAAGHDLDQDGLALAGEIAAETDGNPFFVGEILRNLTESGMLVFDKTAGRWRIDRTSAVALPQSVRDVIGRRVARLGDASRQILTAASVVGRTFDLEVVAHTLDRSEEEVLDAIEVAIESAVVVELPERVGRFAFTHALINHTLYESLTAARRARMHQRIAESLEDLYGPDSAERLTELALHWRLATVSVNREKAARYSLRAGRRALEGLAPAEAARLFGHALEQLGTVETKMRCDALIGLGEAQRQMGESASRETLFKASEIASKVQDAALAARAALANNRGFVSVLGEVDRDRVAAIERALELDRPPEPNRRARLLALLAQELWFEPDPTRRRELADEAVALARSGGDARTMSEVLRNAFQAQWAPDTLAVREGYVRDLVASADACADPALRFWALDAGCDVAVERGEIRRALATIDRMDAIATELAQPVPRWVAMFTRVAITIGQGDLDEAERGAEAAFQIGTNAGQPDARLIYAGQVGRCRRVQGRGEEIVALMEQQVAAHPDWPIWRVVLAETYCWMGRQSDAAPIVAAAAEDGFAHVPLDHTHADSLAGYAEVAAQTGVREAAALLYELLEPYSDQFIWSGASTRGHARLYLGLLANVLGREDLANQHFAFACDFHAANSLLLWAARSHLGWAEALAHRGETGRAREHAARSLELSRRHGYGAFEPRAAAILDAPIGAGA